MVESRCKGALPCRHDSGKGTADGFVEGAPASSTFFRSCAAHGDEKRELFQIVPLALGEGTFVAPWTACDHRRKKAYLGGCCEKTTSNVSKNYSSSWHPLLVSNPFRGPGGCSRKHWCKHSATASFSYCCSASGCGHTRILCLCRPRCGR